MCSLSCCAVTAFQRVHFCHLQLLDLWEHVDANTPDTSSIPLRPKSLLPSAPGAHWGWLQISDSQTCRAGENLKEALTDQLLYFK